MYTVSEENKKILAKLHLLGVRVIWMNNSFTPLWLSSDEQYGAWGVAHASLVSILNQATQNRPRHNASALFGLEILDENHKQKYGYEWVK